MPVNPPSLPQGNYDILTQVKNIRFQKYGYAPFQLLDPPRRYLCMSSYQSFSGGSPESGPLGVTGSRINTIHALTGATVTTGDDFVNTGGQPTSPLIRSGSDTLAGYDDPPNVEDDAPGTLEYQTTLSNENTTAMMVVNGLSLLPEFTTSFQAGTPFAYRNVHQNQLSIDYQKTKFKFRWQQGTTAEQRYALTFLVLFQSEDNPGTTENESTKNAEVVKSIQWDGQTEQSPEYTINPETYKPGVDGTYSLLPVDIDFIKPGTENDTIPLEIDENKEDSEGEVVGINWDDDNYSEGDGGHGKLVFKNDFDDPEGTEGEDDMIQLKLHKPAIDGAKARLKYDNTLFKIWQNKFRKDEVKSEDTEIELTADKVVFLEGRKITEAEAPKIIEMQIKVGANAAYVLGDKISAHVATPIITCGGKQEWTNGKATDNLRDQLQSQQHLGKYRRDDRSNTVILKGKDPTGKTLWYSLYMVDLIARDQFDPKKKPNIVIRSPHKDKEMKMALSLEGCHVFYEGHSNYGIGPNFVDQPETLDDYMNISGRGICRINYEELVSDIHGDESMKPLRPEDYAPGDVVNSVVAMCGIMKFGTETIELRDPTLKDPPGPPLHKFHSLITQSRSHPEFVSPAGGWETIEDQGYSEGLFAERHFWMKQEGGTNYGVIVHSKSDLPVLRYASCFMASCNTGRNFGEALTHGMLLYSMDETTALFGKTLWVKNPDDPDHPILTQQIEGDLFTLISNSPVDAPASWLITHYVRLLVEGKSWQQIKDVLNAKENRAIPRGQTDPAPPTLYDFHSFNN